MEGKRIWEAHPSPYGVPYYYNPQTKESRWSLPTGPLDLVVPVEAQAAPTKKNAKKKEPGKDASEKPLSVSSSASSDSEAEEGNPAKLSVAERTKLKVTAFTEMLEEKEVQAFDSFERWLPSLVTDQRFLAIPKKARKGLFLSVAQGLSKGRRRSEAEQRQSGRAGLQELLGQAKQADWFREAQSTAAAVASLELRFKSDERWQNACEKWRWVEAARQEVAEEKAEIARQAAAAFRALLSETVLRAGPAPSFGEARSRLRHEPRWQGVTSVEARQALYAELAEQLSRRWAAEKKREADDEDDVEAKRQRCRFDVAEQSFRSLLAKKVKTPLDFSWKEATMILEGEELPELPEVDLETIFHEVRTEELQRRLRAFAAFLRSSSHGPEQSFGQALVGAEELLQSVPVAEAKKCWEDWRRWRLTEAEEEFKAWLRQSELLSAQVPTEGPAFEAFCESLANDLRYQRLAPVPSTRKRLILQRLQELATPTCAAADRSDEG